MPDGSDRAAAGTTDPAGRRALPPGVRALLVVAGLVSVVLGAVGLVLPLLPTTPFLLLAGACFARSSTRLHRGLRSSPVLGAYILQWERERTIPPRVKAKALALVGLTYALTFARLDEPSLRLLLVVLAAGSILFIARLPTASPLHERDTAEGDERETAEPVP